MSRAPRVIEGAATIWPDSRKVAIKMIEGLKPEDARKALC